MKTPDSKEDRRRRIVEAANSMLTRLGDPDKLQMKGLAAASDVALATLYDLFPSKDHVLGEVAIMRVEAASRKLTRELNAQGHAGETAGERVSHVLLGMLDDVQRESEVWAASYRVLTKPDRSTVGVAAQGGAILVELVVAATAHGGAELTGEQRQMIPLVIAAHTGALTGWLTGLISDEQARRRIDRAARLLDLPPEVVRTYLTESTGSRDADASLVGT